MSAIHAKLAQLNDRELANVLDQVVHNGFYNFMVDDKNPDWDLKQLMETEFNNAY